MSRRRHLSDDETALWTGFARSIKPLRRPKVATEPPIAADEAAAARPAAAGEARRDARLPARRTAPFQTPPLVPLDRRLKQRVARGREPIDLRIDLHGMTQRQAHAALLRFFERAQTDGARIALIVTGKGAGPDRHDAATERGVLRRQVPIWLALPEFRAFIIGFEAAHAGHGGEGALYVRLRRAR
jgi:DNA-nicking Smr family endonuclease